MNYWLVKSEPTVFSFEDLKKAPQQKTSWDGVRNYQARNFLRDSLKKGDLVLFYHSNCELIGIAGVAEVIKEGYPEKTDSTWYSVDIKWKKDFHHFLTLKELKTIPELKEMKLLQKGQRLSVQPVSKQEFEIIYQKGFKT